MLEKIYNQDQKWVEYELNEIQTAVDSQKNEEFTKESKFWNQHLSLGYASQKFTLIRVLKTPHVRKALLIGCALQFFQTASGINAVGFKSKVDVFRSATIWQQ